MANLMNKTIWVVGASSGIGLALTRALLKTNNFIYATARSTHSLAVLKEQHPNNLAIVQGDITSSDDLQRMQGELYSGTDVLDLVIFSAGTCEYDDGVSLDLDMYKRVFDVNFFACVSCVKIAKPLLMRAGGAIVGLSSLAAVVPFPRAEAYGASKVALEYLLDSMSVDLSDTGISVVKVRPGFVDTPLTQKNDFSMPFLVDTEYAANKIIEGLYLGKKTIDFPWQLSFVLKTFARFKQVWMWLAAKQFRKAQEL